MRGPRVTDVLTALNGAFEAKGWHGPTVLESIRGLGRAAASSHPGEAHHSIHDLIDHIEYWEAMGVHYVTKGALPKRRPKDWARPTISFGRSVRRLKNTHRLLLAAISRLDDSELDTPVKTAGSGRMPLAKVLHGIAAHDTYHAGQIRLLRTML
jgi:uncharacterized damage-inducible protein DinB